MDKRGNWKRVYGVFLTFALVLGMCVPTYGAVARATTMRLAATAGSHVTLKTINGSARKITKNMRLYNGNIIETGTGSYAYISLDSSKAVKMDANAKVQVRQDGKKLQLLVSRGRLFFNVNVPLKSNESLNVQTSTMVTGVRGTCGIIEAVSSDTASVYLLEGALEINWKNPKTGASEPIALKSGEKLTLSKRAAQAPAAEVLAPEDVPAFAAEEVAKDEALQEKITRMGGPDVSKIIETVSSGKPDKPDKPAEPSGPSGPSWPGGPSEPTQPEKPVMPNWDLTDKQNVEALSGNAIVNACKDIDAVMSGTCHTIYFNGSLTAEEKALTTSNDFRICEGKTLVLHGVKLTGKNCVVEKGASLYIDAGAGLELDSIKVEPGGKVYTFGELKVGKKEGDGEVLTGGSGTFTDTSKQTPPGKPGEITMPNWDFTSGDIVELDLDKLVKDGKDVKEEITQAWNDKDIMYIKGGSNGTNTLSLDALSINENKTLVLNGLTITGQEWTVSGSLYIDTNASLQLSGSIKVNEKGKVYTFSYLKADKKEGEGQILTGGYGNFEETSKQSS